MRYVVVALLPRDESGREVRLAQRVPRTGPLRDPQAGGGDSHERFVARAIQAVAWLLMCATLGACQVHLHDLEPPRSQSELARIQARAFDTTDRDRALRAAIVALQDLGFIVDRANDADGSVRGIKLDDYLLNITVTVRPQGTSRTLVRANVRYNVTPVFAAEPYQQFFAALSRAIALEGRPAD